MTACSMRRARLPGAWFYERAFCDCSCIIVTAGRQHLQRGEELFCEVHDRVVKAMRIEAASLAQQDALCMPSQECGVSNG